MVNPNQQDASQGGRHHGALPEHMVDEDGIPPNQERIKNAAAVHTVIGGLDNQLQGALWGGCCQQFIADPGNRIVVRFTYFPGAVELLPVEPDYGG